MGCHIKKVRLKLKELPFYLSYEDILFIDGSDNDFVNRCVAENVDAIRELLSETLYSVDFVHLSLLGRIAADNVEVFRYMAPNVAIEPFLRFCRKDAILDYIAAPQCKSIPPCLIYCSGSGQNVFEGYAFDFDSEEDVMPLFTDLFSRIGETLGITDEPSLMSCKEGSDIWLPYRNDDKGTVLCRAEELFDEESVKLMKDVREKVERLRQHGIEQKILETLIEPKVELSRLVVTKDMRIVLPDYKNMEIKMEPLVKTVYVLFLLHPEGIVFKDLPDYEDEAMLIYEIIMYYANAKKKNKPGLSFSYTKMRKSIQDITNPCLNSINEKCARIRSAFISRFTEKLAQRYFITGRRGTPKKITLDKGLVVWECFPRSTAGLIYSDDLSAKLGNLILKSGFLQYR